MGRTLIWVCAVALLAVAAVPLLCPKDLLHPTSITVGKLSDWPVIGYGKRVVVKQLYEFMADYAGDQHEWLCMNYGYGDLGVASGVKEDMTSGLSDAMASAVLREPFNYQLYFELVSAAPSNALKGKKVVEVGSGRGGGAAFVARYAAHSLAEAGETAVVTKKLRVDKRGTGRYDRCVRRSACIDVTGSRFDVDHLTGLDISPNAVELATLANKADVEGSLSYAVGDAEDLSLIADGSVDVVINVESQHCYASVPLFASEVRRILPTGGLFLFTGFTHADRLDVLKEQLSAGGAFKLINERDITENVVRSLQLDTARKEDLITLLSPAWFTYFARGFAAMDGSAMRLAFESKSTIYSILVLEAV